MKLYKKIIIIISVLLVVAGAVISAIAISNLDFKNGNPFDLAKPNKVSYSVEDGFSDVYVKCVGASVIFAVSDDGKCTVVCDETKNTTYNVSVKDKCLTVSEQDNGKWFNFISFGWYNAKITVYLPQKDYNKLFVTSTSGDVKLPSGLKFNEATLKSTSGDVCFLGEAASLSLSSTSGDVRAEGLTAEGINVRSTSGDLLLSDINCDNLTLKGTSGDISLVRVKAVEHISAESTSGDIRLDDSDAGTLYLMTASGDVSGLLLTSKVFIASSSSGDVSVPQTTNTTKGGICEIKTASGDIKMTFKAD